MLKKIINLLLLLFFISNISANGLNIVGNNNFNINKIIGNDIDIKIAIKNSDSFPFYNITFEDNNFIKMDKINKLNPGEIKNVTATIYGDENINKSLNIVGMYYTNIGVSNETYIINIDYDEGIIPCDISIIKGDSINFTNNANRDIKLINTNNQNEMASILDGQSIIRHFDSSMDIYYYAAWFGFKFSDDCRITVLNDIGYVHNPQYDDNINLNININYEPTTIEATFLKTNYTLQPFDKDSELCLIKNIGNKIAKDITLSGDWMKFSTNHFDLNPGDSKTLTYTISPNIVYTNQTNKTYIKTLHIKGNFNDVDKSFSINIPYMDIDSGNYTQGTNLLSIIKDFCKSNPDVCGGKTKIIYRNSNESLVNVTVASNQLKQIFEYMYGQYSDQQEYQKYMVERIDSFNQTIDSLINNQTVVVNDVKNLKQQFNDSNTFVLFLILGLNVIVILGVGGYIVYSISRKKKLNKLRRLS